MSMINYKEIRKICTEQSRLTEKVFDNFLMNYAASKNSLEKTMVKEFMKYRHILDSLPEDSVSRFMAQYIAHKLFGKDGNINKLITHAELKHLDSESMQFLQRQIENPWRFSFSVITSNPQKDFYHMEDVFTQEEYLLYSPGITQTIEERHPWLWFNLIAFNSHCWQTFGPIAGYMSFSPDDIFFFATELDARIESDEELLEHVSNNPVPYMMLISGSELPAIKQRDDMAIHCISEIETEMPAKLGPQNGFKKEYNKNIYQFSMKEWSDFPHLAKAFYDESKGILRVSAMSERGYDAIVSAINEAGYPMPVESDIRVSTTMLIAASRITGRPINISEYENLFVKESSPEEEETLEALNRFIELIMPEIEAGRVPDIDKMAAAAGLDIENARGIYEQITKMDFGSPE